MSLVGFVPRLLYSDALYGKEERQEPSILGLYGPAPLSLGIL